MFLYLLFKIISLGILMSCLTPVRYSVKKSAIIIVSFHLLSWIANYVGYFFLGEDFISNFLLITASVPALTCFSIVAKCRGFRVVFSLLTVAVFSMLSSFIGNLPYFNTLLLQYSLKFGSFILIIVFVVIVFRKPYIKMLQTLEKGWGILCLVPFILINIISLLQYVPAPIQERPENIPIVAAAFALTFVFYAIFYINFKNISQLFQFRKDKEILSVQTEMYKKQYEATMDYINTMKIYRHDMKHHLSAIDTFLNENDVAEAQKYLRRLNKDINEVIMDQYCDNYIVNVFLSSYIQKAKNEQIEVDCDAEIPQEMNIDSIELGLVFANALDNAIDACRKIECVSGRKISIVCKDHCGQIFIRISNPFTGDIKFDGEFPVSESPGHGIGVRSIAAIVQKYEGVFSFTAQDEVFKTTLSLKYL